MVCTLSPYKLHKVFKTKGLSPDFPGLRPFIFMVKCESPADQPGFFISLFNANRGVKNLIVENRMGFDCSFCSLAFFRDFAGRFLSQSIEAGDDRRCAGLVWIE
jgi:hypothetical protein